eukprot:9237322-Karenia_brevis.AAC.1
MLHQSCDDLFLVEYLYCARHFWYWPPIVDSITSGAYHLIDSAINIKLFGDELDIRNLVDTAISSAKTNK